MSDPASTDPPLGNRFEQALGFAVHAHRHQVRKGSNVPYVGHLLGVCSLVIEDGGSEDEAIAALLHDAVEDQGGQPMLDEIRARFGEPVAAIVLGCSDTTENPKPPWQERKQSYLEHLESAPDPVLRVSLADKLFNARAILRDYRQVGDTIWTRFKAGRDDQLRYYTALAEVFTRRLPCRMASEPARHRRRTRICHPNTVAASRRPAGAQLLPAGGDRDVVRRLCGGLRDHDRDVVARP